MAEEEQEEKQKPLTREDVLKAIEENGGTARGLDLSGKTFEDSIDLRELDLEAIILKEADLSYAHLEGADLMDAHLERADLTNAHLEGAHLYDAHLEGAHLARIILSSETKLQFAKWGNYILGEENDVVFEWAEEAYRQLKQWHTNAGMYGIAGEFFFREMTVKRMQIWWGDDAPFSFNKWKYLFNPKNLTFKRKILLTSIFPQKPIHWAWSKFISLICGYGEKPLRVIIWAASVLLIFTFIYLAAGSVLGWNFWNSLYFSAVSFTALGYGSWLQVTNDWIRGLGAFESFIGVFSMALFLITFIRKMTR